MEVGLVKTIEINEEMQQAYLDYAMSVIVSRALPDARDGLKPVHRRILYAMYDMGLRPDSPYKKSARIVGEVLGKYHPHGDQAVYDAMARMAQDFSMRYMLIDGQGNFGSIDGDPPAAMRYTEARLEIPAHHMLDDIDKDTIDFVENFDGTLREPGVLPAAIPNMLVNGATGIAVGMSTSIPPHNLSEIVDALQYMLANWRRLENITVETLMKHVKGPDFPTGGVIIQPSEGDGLIGAYSTGRGRLTVQARAHLEEMGRGKNRIIVTELPYMTNKSSLIERIADLAREEKIEGIVDLRDESDRQGMRIVIELSKNADPHVVLNNLHKYTPMQGTFSIIMLALVDGEPRLLGLKQALRVYLEHRLEIIRRRSKFELDKARKRAHILDGLQIAIDNLDEVVSIIRRSRTVDTARNSLRTRFKLSVIQAQAILDMQLRRLAALERRKIVEETKVVRRQIRELESLLDSPIKMRTLVSDELQAVKEAHGDRRRTHIIQLEKGTKRASIVSTSDLVPEKNVWIIVGRNGEISRTLEEKAPRLSGTVAPFHIIRANTRDTLYIVCDDGQAAALPVHSLPEAESPSEGANFSTISPLRSGQRIAALFSLPPVSGNDKSELGFDDMFVLTVTQHGMIKKSMISDLPGASANTFTLVKVNKGDKLGWLRLSNGMNEILLITNNGMAIRFDEASVRPMGLVAAGVMGMKLQSQDNVIGMELLPQRGEVFMIASSGFAKRVAVTQFPAQGRYGQGVVAWKLPDNEQITGMTVGKGTLRIGVHTSRLQPKMVRLDSAPIQGRTARGKKIIDISGKRKVIGITIPWETPRPQSNAKRSRNKRKISKKDRSK